jgi:hypothetical protein
VPIHELTPPATYPPVEEVPEGLSPVTAGVVGAAVGVAAGVAGAVAVRQLTKESLEEEEE